MKILNIRDLPRTDGRTILPPNTVRIDRMSRYGNPYRIGDPLDVRAPEGGSIFTNSATRDDVLTAYEWWLEARLQVEPNYLEALRGLDLACWCAPERCHGEVIRKVLGEPVE